jgi:hypothetical protein
MSRKERGRKEVMHMATFRIFRIYEIPAETPVQATNRMVEAIVLHAEQNYHVMDYVKAPDDPKGKCWPIDLTPPKGWLSSMLEELVTRITGKPGWKKPELYVGKSMHELEQEKKKR